MKLTCDEIQAIKFGDGGQFFKLMLISEFVQMNNAITHLKELVVDNIHNNGKIKLST